MGVYHGFEVAAETDAVEVIVVVSAVVAGVHGGHNVCCWWGLAVRLDSCFSSCWCEDIMNLEVTLLYGYV